MAWIQALRTSHLVSHRAVTQKNHIIWKEILKISLEDCFALLQAFTP